MAKTNGSAWSKGATPRQDAAARLNGITKRHDAWVNRVTGYGTQQDKTTHYQQGRLTKRGRQELEALYLENDLAATIVDRPIQDALRQGYGLEFDGMEDNPELAHDIQLWAEQTYQVTHNVFRSNVFARLFGGGAIVYGMDDGQEFSEPPVEGAEVRFLRPVEWYRMQSWLWDADPASQQYGTPEIYQWQQLNYSPSVDQGGKATPSPILVFTHRDRLEIFQGVITTDQQFLRNKGWGDSIFRRILEVLTKFDTAWGSVMTLLQDASQGVYKLNGLNEVLGSDQDVSLADRFRAIDLAKSVFKAIALDAENEDYQRIATPLTEMADVIEKAMIRMAAAAGMPVTVLFGDSPSGLNATGASDLRNYYDTIRANQKFNLGPAYERIYTRLLAQPDSPTNGTVPENLRIVWPSLWQMSPTEEAALYQMLSQADAGNVAAGILDPREAAIHRAQAATRWGFPRIDVSVRQEVLEALMEPESMIERATVSAGPVDESGEQPPVDEDPDEEAEEGSEDETENN